MREHANLPANFNDRINAFAIDLGIIALIVVINIFMQYTLWIKIAVILGSWICINIIPGIFKKGQSLGKISAKIKVANNDNSVVSFKRYTIRALLILILGYSTVGIYFVVAFLLSQRRLDKRALHDLLCNTKVIRTEVFVQLTE